MGVQSEIEHQQSAYMIAKSTWRISVLENEPHQEEVVIFGLSTQVFEYTLLPVSLHVIPILNHTMSDRIMHTVCLGIGHRLVANMEIEVLDPSFGSQIRTTRYSTRAPSC